MRTNVIGNVLCTSRIGGNHSSQSQVIVIEGALLLENNKPLLLEDGRHLQAEKDTFPNKKK